MDKIEEMIDRVLDKSCEESTKGSFWVSETSGPPREEALVTDGEWAIWWGVNEENLGIGTVPTKTLTAKDVMDRYENYQDMAYEYGYDSVEDFLENGLYLTPAEDYRYIY